MNHKLKPKKKKKLNNKKNINIYRNNKNNRLNFYIIKFNHDPNTNT